jgi:hypothetical protein
MLDNNNEIVPERTIENQDIKETIELYKLNLKRYIDKSIPEEKKISFLTGLKNLVTRGKWDPEKQDKMAKRNRAMVEAKEEFLKKLRLIEHNNIIFDPVAVTSMFYREELKSWTITFDEKSNIIINGTIDDYMQVSAKVIAALFVLSETKTKCNLKNYIINKKYFIKRKAIQFIHYKKRYRAPDFVIIDLKGGSHLNINMTNDEFDILQDEIMND